MSTTSLIVKPGKYKPLHAVSRTEMNTSATANPHKRKLRSELHDVDTVIKRVRRYVPEG